MFPTVHGVCHYLQPFFALIHVYLFFYASLFKVSAGIAQAMEEMTEALHMAIRTS